MAKIAIAKGTIVVLILVAVLVAGGVSAGVLSMSVSPQGMKGDKGDTGATGATGASWCYWRNWTCRFRSNAWLVSYASI